MKKYLRFAVLLLTLSALVMALGGVGAQDAKILYTGRQMGPDDIPTLDPSVASDVPSVAVIAEIFPELARLHEETAQIQPGMATWTVSEDGLTYTFNIMPEVSWVKYNADSGAVEQVMIDGAPRYVTAADYALGMTRTLDPIVASDYSYVLAPWVVGADAFQASAEATEEERQALIDGLGITVVDDYTLEVNVTRASTAFEFIVGMWITAAQPGWVIEEYADFWIEPENIVSYGPFAVKDWTHEESLTMIKNPFWAGTESIPAPKLDEVVFRFLDEDPQLAAFEAGELDVSEVPFSALARVKADPVLSQQYYSDFGTCTYYYGFNVRQAPFNDPRAVLAFSMALDRQAIADNITQAGELPAGFFTLPSMNAAPQQADYPEYAVLTDVEAAKALWEEYLTETGQSASDFSPTILYNNSDLHAAVAQAVQQMWAEALGVTVNVAAQDFGTYLDQREDADIYRAAWCFDYPDTNNWLYDVFHSANDPDNGFNNAEFDDLVSRAAVEEDLATRTALYAEAERLLVRDAASVAPIYYYVTDDITADGIERTHSVITREYYEKWDITR
jgi:oligopeptide transport system substrate-binding protein